MFKKLQKQEVYRPLVPQKPKQWNKCKQTNKPEAEHVVNEQEAQAPSDPKVLKGQKAQLNDPEAKHAQLKRENYPHQEPEANRPRNEKHLLKIYLVKK